MKKIKNYLFLLMLAGPLSCGSVMNRSQESDLEQSPSCKSVWKGGWRAWKVHNGSIVYSKRDFRFPSPYSGCSNARDNCRQLEIILGTYSGCTLIK